MSQIVETNIYRVLKPCSNCPFVDDGVAIHLRDGRVNEIKAYLLENTDHSFSCHKTAYNLDVDMNLFDGTQQPKMCAGAYFFLKKVGKPNAMMQIAKRIGIE